MSGSERRRFLPRASILQPLTWALLVVLAGCVHTIQVHPLPSAPTTDPIPRRAHLIVRPATLTGADHKPGIALLDWPHRNLQEAITRYVQQRGTFLSVGDTPADLTVTISPALSLKYRDRYRYRIRLQADVTEGARSSGTYVAEQEAEGSSVRWVTASDRDPIEAALRSALDDLLARLEADRLHDGGTGRTELRGATGASGR